MGGVPGGGGVRNRTQDWRPDAWGELRAQAMQKGAEVGALMRDGVNFGWVARGTAVILGRPQ